MASRWVVTVFANTTYRVELQGLPKGAAMPEFFFRYIDVDRVRGPNCLGKVLLESGDSKKTVQSTLEDM